jgi:hypothetical protein
MKLFKLQGYLLHFWLLGKYSPHRIFFPQLHLSIPMSYTLRYDQMLPAVCGKKLKKL